MPHLIQFRAGWENEHLATHLLARLAFIARPATVADDVGTDLYCTLFQIVTSEDGRDYAHPRNSFAVQVKSGSSAVDATKHIEYLINLEVPYFIGVVDHPAQTLRLYSARYLPHLLSLGRPSRLLLKPVDDAAQAVYGDASGGGKELYCPLVTSLRLRDDRAARDASFALLHADIVQTLRAIASKLGHEYIFETPTGLQIIAGQTSARHYQENFFRRLAEVFYNLRWQRGAAVDTTGVERDIAFYLQFYHALRARQRVPDYLVLIANMLTPSAATSAADDGDVASGSADKPRGLRPRRKGQTG